MPASAREVEIARRFTRFYTRETELLDEAYLRSRFSLTEGRVLYELAARSETSAAALGRDLRLDRGYLSRMLKRFEGEGLVTRAPARDDARQQILSLTPAGHEAFAPLDRLSHDQWSARLDGLSPATRRELAGAMARIETLLGAAPEAAPITLRPHGIGDLGWVSRRQGRLYAEEYGWDASFEALVAEILVDFVRTHDPERERGWIAERQGAGEPDILGSIYCVRQSDEVAKLRLLYVEPAARGTGLGSRLVGECIAFARERGYRRLVLWTNDCLDAARHIYVRAGFTLIEEERHHSFGVDLVGQNWALDL